MIVVDGSVLRDFLLGRSETTTALLQELAGHDYEPLHAPELVEPETLNALRRMAMRGMISERRATEAASDLADLNRVRYRHAPLTGDAGLAARARDSLSPDRVRHVV